ncbi:MAG: flagellar biosynthesis protein FlhA [Fibromonadaceae bacterium]|jgi:flagellar biosynthesis protein FlhA|nr:flagellar biosynthesis protein FlhA [Fibromonadaceae bacterium]
MPQSMQDIKGLIKNNPLSKSNDALVILGIVCIVLMLVVPVPPILLDILLTCMIGIALMVLMISMVIDRVLDFAVYPSLLLVVTLFRLSLNVASTRLILADGNAGQVIQTFGTFVTSGNFIVGTIMFLILVIIQFVVITKGSTRIAEVAARFTLDAMPGKQMAIDADLNAGHITEEEAKERREDIRREADFYGAMDGASKFVRGDAIAGLIITGINIIGGFILGVAMLDMSALEAIQRYTILTIGDGLVSQIPALMISTSSGIIVTRAASKNNLGAELISQMAQSAKALAITAFVMMLLGIVPGMPMIPFWSISALLGFMAYRMTFGVSSKQAQKDAEKAKKAAEEAAALPKEEKIEDYLLVDQMELEIGYGLIPLVDVNQGGDLLERITMLRRQMAGDLGIIVPPIRIRDNIQLSPNEYLIKIKGNNVGKGELMMGSYLAMNPGNISQKIPGIKTKEPAFNLDALWITESQKEAAELAGYTVIELPAVLATHLTEIIKRYASEILMRQDVKTLIENVKKNSPAIVEEISGLLGIGEIQQVMCMLLQERVSVKNLASILELIANAAKISKDAVFINEQVRLGLTRQICEPYINKDTNQMPVIAIAPDLEQMLEASVQGTNRGPRLVIRPDLIGRIMEKMDIIQTKILSSGDQPVIVCSPNVRYPLKKLLESNFPNLVVLSYSEIITGVNITVAETLSTHD